jgi:hypothetical protein
MADAPADTITATEWQQALNRVDLRARQIGIGELHGLPLRYWQSVADQTRQIAHSTRITSVTVVSGIQDDGARHLDRRRKALSYLLGPDLEPRFPLEGLTVVPTLHDTLFLTLSDQELPRSVQRAATRLAEVPQPGTSSAARLFQVKARSANDVITLRRRSNVPVTDGLRLVVLDVPTQVQPGQTAALAAYLLVESTSQAPDEARVPYVELPSIPNRPPVSVRRGGLETSEWLPGDLLIQQLNLTVPVDLADGDYDLRFGLAPTDSDEPPSTTAPAATLRVRSTP